MRTTQHKLKNDLIVRQVQKAYDLTPMQKKVRLDRMKGLNRMKGLGEHDQFPKIVFSGEEDFQIEKFVNSQNDCIYSAELINENLTLRLTTRKQYPAQEIIWVTPNFFI